MSKFTPEELELIEVLKKYGSRINLARKVPGVLHRLYRGKRNDILDEALPKSYIKWSKELCIYEARKYKTRKEWQVNSASSYCFALKNKFIEICSRHMKKSKRDGAKNKLKKLTLLYQNGKSRPKINTKLGLYYYQKKRRNLDVMKQLFPKWEGNPQFTRSFERMKKLMPKHLVSFKEGQKWKGSKSEYWFVCKKYGAFKSNPNRIIGQSWKKGLSGHPIFGRISAAKKRCKKIKRSDGQIFNSLTEVAKKYGVPVQTICRAIKRNTKFKSYTFKYVD